VAAQAGNDSPGRAVVEQNPHSGSADGNVGDGNVETASGELKDGFDLLA
jgi:hypothetical protein